MEWECQLAMSSATIYYFELVLMLDKFSWLHISDFHFKAGVDTFSQVVSCEALINDIPIRLSDKYPLQFVAVTGDIAFSGKASEYGIAETFFGTLTQSLDLDFDRICIAPGNHDVDRGIHEYLYDGVQNSLTNQQAVDKFLGEESDRCLLMKRQSAFYEFRERLFSGSDTVETDDGLARVRYFDLDGFRISILELNTAWLAGPKDRPGNLLMGERQVINALAIADAQQPHLTIALAHHPAEWLSEFDKLSCFNRLIPRLDVFHNGHLHQHQVSVDLMPGTQCLHTAAGSSHETRHYLNSYNLIEYDAGNAICRIRQFEYRADSGVFQEMEPIEYTLPSAKNVRVTSAEIASAIRDIVHSPEPYQDYMAAMLSGDLDDVPISLGPGDTTFASKNLPTDLQFEEVQNFLRMANLLRVHDAVPLSEIFASHEGDIRAMAGLLSRLSSADSQFADMLDSRAMQARRLSDSRPSNGRSYQELYLEQLATERNIAEVIDTATRYCESPDDSVQKAARKYLAPALLQSDDQVQKSEGVDLAFKNLNELWADSQDYLLASAAAESIEDYGRAENTALIALQTWPDDPQVRDYCRTLATQTGSQTIRRQLDAIGGDTQ